MTKHIFPGDLRRRFISGFVIKRFEDKFKNQLDHKKRGRIKIHPCYNPISYEKPSLTAKAVL